MDKKMLNNLKIIYGLDLVVFGIVLACDLASKSFSFNDYWCLFLTLPSIADILLNKLNVFNGSLLVLSASVLGYFVFSNAWVCLIVFVIMVGLILIFGKYLSGKKAEEKSSL